MPPKAIKNGSANVFKWNIQNWLWKSNLPVKEIWRSYFLWLKWQAYKVEPLPIVFNTWMFLNFLLSDFHKRHEIEYFPHLRSQVLYRIFIFKSSIKNSRPNISLWKFLHLDIQFQVLSDINTQQVCTKRCHHVLIKMKRMYRDGGRSKTFCGTPVVDCLFLLLLF